MIIHVEIFSLPALPLELSREFHELGATMRERKMDFSGANALALEFSKKCLRNGIEVLIISCDREEETHYCVAHLAAPEPFFCWYCQGEPDIHGHLYPHEPAHEDEVLAFNAALALEWGSRDEFAVAYQLSEEDHVKA